MVLVEERPRYLCGYQYHTRFYGPSDSWISPKGKPKLFKKMGLPAVVKCSCLGLLMQASSLVVLLIHIYIDNNFIICFFIYLLLGGLCTYKYILLTLVQMLLGMILFQAISCYTKAQNLRPDPIILGNRSLAFCRWVSWRCLCII